MRLYLLRTPVQDPEPVQRRSYGRTAHRSRSSQDGTVPHGRKVPRLPEKRCRSPAACSCPPRPEPPGRSAACGSLENRYSRTPLKASERPAWRKVKAFCRTPLFAERYCGNVFEYVPISGQRTLSKSFPDSADVRACEHQPDPSGKTFIPGNVILVKIIRPPSGG